MGKSGTSIKNELIKKKKKKKKKNFPKSGETTVTIYVVIYIPSSYLHQAT